MDTIDISGKWSLSRILSDDIEEILVLQGFGYFLRKAAKIGTVTLIFKHDPKGAPPTLDITIFPPGGFAKERRTRKIDGHTVIDKHFILGTNNVTWRPRAKGDVDGYFAEEAWEGDHLLEELVESVDGAWTIEGIWGLIEKDGKKYLIKRDIITTKDGRSGKTRQVFEYAPLDP